MTPCLVRHSACDMCVGLTTMVASYLKYAIMMVLAICVSGYPACLVSHSCTPCPTAENCDTIPGCAGVVGNAAYDAAVPARFRLLKDDVVGEVTLLYMFYGSG